MAEEESMKVNSHNYSPKIHCDTPYNETEKHSPIQETMYFCTCKGVFSHIHCNKMLNRYNRYKQRIVYSGGVRNQMSESLTSIKATSQKVIT